jgi:hypothetical protein
MMAFVNVFWWEFVQNAPFVMATIIAMRLWNAGLAAWAILAGLAGCAGSAAAISLTEPYKLRTTVGQDKPTRELGGRAQIREFVVNSLAFAGGTLLAALYFGLITRFGALQKYWLSDVAVGGVTGWAVASIQNIGLHPAGPRASHWPHVLAFVVMGPIVLSMARLVLTAPSQTALLAGALLLALLMTLIICCIEYLPFLKTI